MAGVAAPFVGVDVEALIGRVPNRPGTGTDSDIIAPSRDGHMIRRHRGGECQERQSNSSVEAHNVVSSFFLASFSQVSSKCAPWETLTWRMDGAGGGTPR